MNIKFLPLALNIGGGCANILISALFWYLFNRKPHKWYADNTDWYVVIDAIEEDGTTIYMNVSEDDQLTVNTIGEGETLISLWDIYNRVK